MDPLSADRHAFNKDAIEAVMHVLEDVAPLFLDDVPALRMRIKLIRRHDHLEEVFLKLGPIVRLFNVVSTDPIHPSRITGPDMRASLVKMFADLQDAVNIAPGV